METEIKLIFCGGNNKRATRIAKEMGIRLGARLPGTLYEKDIFFADQDWKKPDRQRYVDCLSEYKPSIATVLDLEKEEQLDEVLGWAEDASKYVNKIIIIPKVNGIIKELPRSINDKEVLLGYSVPTGYGGTTVPLEEFQDWNVHLLGGLPHHQLILNEYLNVYSVDTNYIMLKALTYNCFWTGLYNNHSRIWVQMKDVGLDEGQNWNYVAFALSCSNLLRAWDDVSNGRKLHFSDKYEKFREELR